MIGVLLAALLETMLDYWPIQTLIDNTAVDLPNISFTWSQRTEHIPYIYFKDLMEFVSKFVNV